MAELLIVILHDTERLSTLLEAWDEAGIPGVTIFSSIGGYQAKGWLDKIGLGSLAQIFESGDFRQRTLISLIDDDQLLEKAISTADHVIKGFDRPQSGILFTVPVGNILGLQKWSDKKDSVGKEKIPSSDKSEDKGKENLMEWLRVTAGIEPKKKYGSIQVANVMEVLSLKPAVVKADTQMNEVLSAYYQHNDVPIICVINSEHHLVGIIKLHTLADALLAPFFPDEYLSNARDYETLLRYSEQNGKLKAGDIQTEPIYVNKTDSLGHALEVMRKHGLDGITVVDDHYHVEGYINMMSVIGGCIDLSEGTPK